MSDLMGTPIIAAPTVPFRGLLGCVPTQATDWYLRALVALWDAGRATGVDPVVLAAQCAHETGWGRFGGAVTPEMGNTCGLKVRNAKGDRPQDHAAFPMAEGYPFVGALAHAHHLRLYAGFPVPPDTPDPRAVFLKPGTAGFGSALCVEDLGGKWAPSKVYGIAVADKVKLLRGGEVMAGNDEAGDYVRPEDRIRQGARGGQGGLSYLDSLEARIQALEAWRDAEEARQVREEYAAHQEDVERREREG